VLEITGHSARLWLLAHRGVMTGRRQAETFQHRSVPGIQLPDRPLLVPVGEQSPVRRERETGDLAQRTRKLHLPAGLGLESVVGKCPGGMITRTLRDDSFAREPEGQRND